MSIPKSHYFEARPAVASRRRTVRLRLGDLDLELQADRGVFGSKGIDAGTMVLLREAPPPPESGDVLDLGCGYGPIAIAVARRPPGPRTCRPWRRSGSPTGPSSTPSTPTPRSGWARRHCTRSCCSGSLG